MYTFNDVKFLNQISNKDICNLQGINTDELMRDTYMRAWIRIWLSIKRNSSIFSKSHYDNKDLFLTDTFVIRSFVPSSKITKFESIIENDDIPEESNISKTASTNAMKAKANSNEGIRIILKFKYENNFFVVSIANISTSNEEIFHVEDYKKALTEEMAKVNERLENSEIFTKRRFLHYIFESLNNSERSIATGIDIEHLWNIYFKAKECFPDFTMLDTKAQFAILQRAFYYASKAKIKDIHTYAKEVIHVLHDKNLLSKFVYKKKEYTLLKKNYRDTKTQSGKVRRALYSLDYTDGLFRTSFKPFDIWNSLTRTSTSDDEDE